MPLRIPNSADEIINRAKTDVQRQLPAANPHLRNSWLHSLIVAISNRIYDYYLQMRAAIDQSFPDTATDDDLARWAAIWGITRQAASAASGSIACTGSAGSVLPAGTVWASSSGETYTTASGGTVSAQTVSVTSITRSGSVATATTASAHNLAANVPVTISGAAQTEYNVSGAAITVTGASTFTYPVSGAPATPATGTISASFTAASIAVTSDGFGADQNQESGAALTLQSPIAGVDNLARVDFGAIGGGTDQETDDALRARFLDRLQNPIAHFSASEIIARAKRVPGVTRVWVEEITPAAGQVTIYFARDNDDSPIPDASEVSAVAAEIEKIRPAHTDPTDVFVLSPSALTVPFTFSALSPNTATMRDAVTRALEQLFDEGTEVGTNLPADAYRSAIYTAVDAVTGGTVDSFTLTTPAGDIAVASGQLPVLGSVTYP